MKPITTFILIVATTLIAMSCNDRRSNNIEISQSSSFDRSAHAYSIRTKISITNRFGFSLASNDWIAATKNASEVDEILKNQRKKADSIYRVYK